MLDCSKSLLLCVEKLSCSGGSDSGSDKGNTSFLGEFSWLLLNKSRLLCHKLGSSFILSSCHSMKSPAPKFKVAALI